MIEFDTGSIERTIEDGHLRVYMTVLVPDLSALSFRMASTIPAACMDDVGYALEDIQRQVNRMRGL